MFKFKGKIIGLDKYNRIKAIVNDPTVLTKKINDVKNPYEFTEDGKLECTITLLDKHKEHFMKVAESHNGIYVIFTVTTKKYSFDGKCGTSLILKAIDVPYI